MFEKEKNSESYEVYDEECVNEEIEEGIAYEAYNVGEVMLVEL